MNENKYLGVLTSSTNPIDLTASLFSAYEKAKCGYFTKVYWILEKFNSENVFNELSCFSKQFDFPFDIKVIHQEDIDELSPSIGEIDCYFEKIFDSYFKNCPNKRIRIHHGAICVKDKCRNKKLLRYVQRTNNNENIYFENKKSTRGYHLDEFKDSEVYPYGSFNLSFLNMVFEIAHLPWYCIDTPIAPFLVNEIIMPPEGCSNIRFGVNSSRLFPSGYSVQEYIHNNSNRDLVLLNDLMIRNGTYIHSRKSKMNDFTDHEYQKCVERSAENIWKCFDFSITSIVEVYISMIKLIRLCKMLRSSNSEYVNLNENMFFMHDNTGNLYNYLVDKATLLNGIACSYMSIYDTTNFKVLKPAQIASVIKRRATDLIRVIINNLYYSKSKANIPNLLNTISNQSIIEAFDSILIDRSENSRQLVKGSIFDYD